MNIFLLYHLTTKLTKYRLEKSSFVDTGSVEKLAKKESSDVIQADDKDKIVTTLPSAPVVSKEPENVRKKYARFPLYKLPPCTEENEPTLSLAKALLSRKSSYEFLKPLTLSVLSPLLYYSIGLKKEENGRKKRMYPSGGAKYPIEPYLFIFEPVEGIPSGVFHYDEDEHGLRLMRPVSQEEWKTYTLTTYAFTKKTKAALIMSAVIERTQEKYGDWSYRYVLLEAGGIAQNVGLVAVALDRPAVQMGGLIEELAEELLDIDGSTEFVVHSIFFG